MKPYGQLVLEVGGSCPFQLPSNRVGIVLGLHLLGLSLGAVCV